MATNFRVKKRKGEPIQKLLKRFKRYYQEFGIREEVFDRRYYTKPTTKRRKQKLDAIRLHQLEVKIKKEEDGIRIS